MSFSEEKLFDIDATDDELQEQIELFFKEGGTGRQLIRMIMMNPKRGIANHTTRIINSIKEKGSYGKNRLT